MLKPKTRIIITKCLICALWIVGFFYPIHLAITYKNFTPLILPVLVLVSIPLYFFVSHKVKKDLEQRSKNGTLTDYLEKRSKPSSVFKISLAILLAIPLLYFLIVFVLSIIEK